MRGTTPTLPLTVNESILTILNEEYVKGTNTVTFKKRLGIILDGISSNKCKYQSAQKLGLKWDSVKLWRDRWEDNIDFLMTFSREGKTGSGEPPKRHELLKEIQKTLANKKGQGAPNTFTLAQKEQIVTMACEEPERHGIPMTNWTYRMLAKAAIDKGIVDEISSQHIWNILKKRSKAT